MRSSTCRNPLDPARASARVGRLDCVPAECAGTVEVLLACDHPQEPHAHGAPSGVRDLEDLVGRQQGLERAHVGVEPRAAKLHRAPGELRQAHVVLMVPEDHVSDRDRVETIDHRGTLVEARQDARRQEVTSERHEESVRWTRLPMVLREALQARQVVQRVDVVDADDAQRRPFRRRWCDRRRP